MAVTLSIIVPVYNVHKYLENCINSILAQTFTDFELIIVDDGSTDGSSEICDTFPMRDSRVRVIHKENGGVVSARKAGLRVATGIYAGYVDGDDWIERDMYEKMVHFMQKYDCDLVMCDIIHESKAIPFSSGATRNTLQGGYYSKQDLCESVFPRMLYAGQFYEFGVYPVIWNKLYRRDKLIRHQENVDDIIRTGEDAACVYPYLLGCESLYFIKDLSLYHYRYSEHSMTAAYDEMYFERFKALYRFFSNSELALSPYSHQLDYYYAYLIKTSVSNELRKGTGLSFREKLGNIKKICLFAKQAGFAADIVIKETQHRLYFNLVRRSRPLMLIACIYVTKFVQKLFGRR